MKIELGLTTFNGGFAFDPANFPCGFLGGDGAVSQAASVVEDTSIVLISQGEDIHQTNATARVFDHTTVNLGHLVVEDESHFTCGLSQTKHVTDHEGHGHAVFKAVGTGGGAGHPNGCFTGQRPAARHGQTLQVIAAHGVQLLFPVNLAMRKRSDSSS